MHAGRHTSSSAGPPDVPSFFFLLFLGIPPARSRLARRQLTSEDTGRVNQPPETVGILRDNTYPHPCDR